MIEINEEAILCCMLKDKPACVLALSKLKPTDFYQYKHQTIFETMQKIHKDRKDVDLITVSDALRQRNLLDKIGGSTYLAMLAGTVPTAGFIETYTKNLKEESEKRQLKKALETSLQLLNNPTESHEEILSQTQKAIRDVLLDRQDKPYITALRLMLNHTTTLESREKSTGGISWGYHKLNENLGYISPQRMYLIGARPGMGKTGLGLGIGLRIAAQKQPVYIATMEMSDEQIADRLVSSVSRIEGRTLERGKLTELWTKINNASSKISNLPIAVDDSRQSTTELMIKARQFKDEMGGKLGAVVVDYLQLFNDSHKGLDKDEWTALVSGNLVQMAKELNTSVICLSQLNRENEKTADKKPQLSHLRGGGSQEQDAWAVLLLHREEYYKPKTKENQAEVIIAKNRSGPTGIVTLKFEGQYSLFTEFGG